MPQFAGLGKRYDGPIDTVVRVPGAPDPKFAARHVNRPRARRETSVYTDEASSSLLAFTGLEATAGGPAVTAARGFYRGVMDELSPSRAGTARSQAPSFP